MKANPFYKYLGPEDRMQNKVMTYLQLQYPQAIYTHPPNEGKRTPFERFKLKFLGAKAGVPDILIFTPNKSNNGLAIELKAGKKKPTESQEQWLKDLKACGWASYCSCSLEDTLMLIDKYFNDDI